MRKDKNKFKDTFIYSPKSLNQKKYIDYLNDENIKLIIAIGPAGTGKTLFACLKAITELRNGEINKLVITRPVVTVEEDIGFLPGNIVKKMDPWTRPIFDLFLEFFSKSELDNYIHNNIIEISPLAFMRGRTFKNAFIIADEMQNSSPNQMKMLTTRIGTNSKMVITGDLNQTDIVNNNGLSDLINRLNSYQRHIDNNITETINIVEFQKRDIERSDVVKKIIDIYDFNYNKRISEDTKNVVLPLLQETTITTNITNTNNNNTTDKPFIKKNNYNIINNDAALIPKHHIIRNNDIFFDNSLM
jgi:phosphate starvation-inducible PhoH-like protein